jgi:hypothetical protein
VDSIPEPLRPLVAAGMAKDPVRRPTDATTFITELTTAASAAYGRHWHDRGRSHLGEAALLLAALWPSGAPPTVQSTTVNQIPLVRRIKLRHISAVKAGLAASVAIAAVAAGTALADTGSQQPTSSNNPSAAGQPASFQLPLSSSPTASSSSPLSGQGKSSPPGGGSGTSSGGGSVPPSGGGSGTSSGGGSVPPSGSGGGSPPVPEITSATTYTQGELVYFDIDYSDPGNDAEGFGFVGVNGSGWAEENHLFSSPSYGIVGTNSIAYPFNEACGTAQQYPSYVRAWIYDTAGDRSTPVTIHLVCTG